MRDYDPWAYLVLAGDGFELSLDGDKLLVSPADRLDAETRAFILAHRDAIIATCNAVERLRATFDDWNAEVSARKLRSA